jgi:GGDEF domain-containing protein
LQSTVKDSKSQLTNKFLKTESEINADPTSTQELLEGMMAGNISYLDAQQNLLEAMVAAYPDYLEARIKLKNIYLQKDLKQKAAQECLEIAKIYKELNQKEKAKKTLKEAYENDPTLRKDAIDSQETFGDSDEKIVSKETELLTDPKISNITAQQSKLPSEVISCHNKNNTEVDLTSIFSNQVVTNPPISNKIAAQKLPNESLSPLSFVDITFLQEKNALLDREWRRAVRSNEEISLVAVKIDGFMDYLWNLGEAFIEECRTKILKAIQDTLFRGGDQVVNCIRKDILILILPDTSREGAILIVERINSSIAKIKLDQLNSSLTLSQVIASAKPKRNNNPSILLEQLVNNYSKLTTNNQII